MLFDMGAPMTDRELPGDKFLKAPPVVVSTPVIFQEQLRKIGTLHWSKWTECSEADYCEIKANPLRNGYGWEWRARKLFVDISEDYK